MTNSQPKSGSKSKKNKRTSVRRKRAAGSSTSSAAPAPASGSDKSHARNQQARKLDSNREARRRASGDESVQAHTTTPESTDVLAGPVSVNPRGFGFVSGINGEAFIPPALVARVRLVDGDEVVAKIRVGDDARMSVTKIESCTRVRTRLFGVIERRGKEVWLRADPWLSSIAWQVAGVAKGSGFDSLDDLVAGEAVTVAIIGRQVRVLKGHGSSEANEALWARSLERGRVAERIVGDGAKKRGGVVRSDERTPKRVDLTKTLTFTIDGPESRDLDDALSVQVLGGGIVRFYVHVADVAETVHTGSGDDVRARSLGTSVYLPGRVVTMLSEGVSFDSCSLLEGQVRAAMTTEMDVDASGDILASRVYPSTICSDARLTYVDVAACLAGKPTSREISPDLARALEVAHVVATRLGAVRAARGGLRSKRNEGMHLIMTEQGLEPVGHDGADVAHDLIEEAMIAANETVASWLVERGLSGVFRTHEAPGPEAAEALETFAEGLGVVAILGEKVTPRALSALERQLKERGFADADIWEVLMGQLGRATYQSEVGDHFGLASEAYVHFTSPIRRYADLTVHRIVKAVLAGKRVAGGLELAELCADLNVAVAQAAKAERVATTLLWLKWMVKNLPVGATTRGRIIKLSKRGALVHLDNTGVSGWVSPSGSGPVEVDDDGLVLTRGTTTWRLGWVLDVKVTGLDLEAGSVELGLVKQQGA